MSSYFDKFDQDVRQLAADYKDDESFLLALKELEAPMIRTCELFAGDVDTPHDVRETVIRTIHANQVVYDGGDYLGGKIGDVLLPSKGTQYAAVCRASKLSREMHSLFHTIAGMRITTRYGLIMDNPWAAVRARDAHAESKAKRIAKHAATQPNY